MREKKKMHSEKQTPIKKHSKVSATEQSSVKKQQKKTVPSSAHKNILAISDFPVPKEQRINLKVNLLK